jgi:hypothetical protein
MVVKPKDQKEGITARYHRIEEIFEGEVTEGGMVSRNGAWHWAR